MIHVARAAKSRSTASPPSTRSGSGTDCALPGPRSLKRLLIGPALVELPPEVLPPRPPPDEPPLEPPLDPPDEPPELGAAVAAVLVDRDEQRAVDVVHRVRVRLDVRVRVQVLDRLRVAGDRIEAQHVRLMREPVVDDVLPAVVRRRRRRGRRGRRDGGRGEQRDGAHGDDEERPHGTRCAVCRCGSSVSSSSSPDAHPDRATARTSAGSSPVSRTALFPRLCRCKPFVNGPSAGFSQC